MQKTPENNGKDSPLPTLSEIHSSLRQLDFCAESREEPHEYDLDVRWTAQKIARHLSAKSAARKPAEEALTPFPAELLVEPLLNFIYLYEYPARYRVSRVPTTAFASFIEIFLEEMKFPPSPYVPVQSLKSLIGVAITEIYLFIRETGYEADYSKICRAIEKSVKNKPAHSLKKSH